MSDHSDPEEYVIHIMTEYEQKALELFKLDTNALGLLDINYQSSIVVKAEILLKTPEHPKSEELLFARYSELIKKTLELSHIIEAISTNKYPSDSVIETDHKIIQKIQSSVNLNSFFSNLENQNFTSKLLTYLITNDEKLIENIRVFESRIEYIYSIPHISISNETRAYLANIQYQMHSLRNLSSALIKLTIPKFDL